MKFVLLFMFALCFCACSADEKAVNSNNPKPTNKNVAIINNTPIVANKNVSNNIVNSGAKTINLGEKITLKSGETAKVKDSQLELKIVTIGSMSLPSTTKNAQTGSAIGFCRVEATLNGKTDGKQVYNQSGRNEFDFEGFKIQVQNVTPTGNIDCSLIVTKIGK